MIERDFKTPGRGGLFSFKGRQKRKILFYTVFLLLILGLLSIGAFLLFAPKQDESRASGTNLITNSSFEDASGANWYDPWTFLARNGATATLTEEVADPNIPDGSKAAKVEVTAVASNDWDVQLLPGSQTLQAGEEYTINFWAKSSGGIDSKFTIQQINSPYTEYLSQDFTGAQQWTTTWQEYTYLFTPSYTEELNFNFNLAHDTGTFWIDNLSVVQNDQEPITYPITSEGSANLINYGGSRPALMNNPTIELAGIPATNVHYVYAERGETINLGSSALGVGDGNVFYTAPDGSSGDCLSQSGGLIANINEEIAGPLPNSGGYQPCTLSVDSASKEGVWQVTFESPSNDDAVIQNGIPINQDWTQDTTNLIYAWGITVRDSSGDFQPGRTYTKHLPMSTGTYTVRVNSILNILTREGYLYRYDSNGFQGYTFIFFSNNKGLYDDAGDPLYRSSDLEGSNSFNDLPDGTNLHRPFQADTTEDFTHKIFYNEPDASMPVVSNSSQGQDWLYPDTVSFDSSIEPQNFQFTEESFGDSSGSGDFTFDSDYSGNYSITIDVNQDSIFGNGNDVVLAGISEIGYNSIYWDGLDSLGDQVPSDNQTYTARISVHLGEVHFPFIDVEHNRDGTIIERVIPTGGSNPYLIYYDDSTITMEQPSEDPNVFPEPPDPIKALEGIDSSSGAHTFNHFFGNIKLLDTWTYLGSDSETTVTLTDSPTADLAVEKTHAPEEFTPNEMVQYEIILTNNGPSDVSDAIFSDEVPYEIDSELWWDCEIITGNGACGSDFSAGTTVEMSIDLDAGSQAKITIEGTLSDTSLTSLANTATFYKYDEDFTEIDYTNNESTTVAPIVKPPDLAITKVANPQDIYPGDEVTYTLSVENLGDGPATGVEVIDDLPDGMVFVSASDGGDENEDGDIVWPVFDLTSGAAKDLTLTFRVDSNLDSAVSTIPNFATVTDDGTHGADTDESNNEAEEEIGVLVQEPNLADLAITIDTDLPNQTFQPSEDIPYTIDYINRGNLDFAGFQIVIDLPEHTSFNPDLSSPEWTCQDRTCTWEGGKIQPRESGQIDFVLTVDDDAPDNLQSIESTVNIAPTDGTEEITLINNVDTISVPVEKPTPQTTTTTGLIFYDSNNNGSRDPGEPGLDNVTVIIEDEVLDEQVANSQTQPTNLFSLPVQAQSNLQQQEVETDENGIYFANVNIGQVSIDIDQNDPDIPEGAVVTTGTYQQSLRAEADSENRAVDVGVYVPPGQPPILPVTGGQALAAILSTIFAGVVGTSIFLYRKYRRRKEVKVKS